jgi:ubiquinone/menaquinone biosynthesis C-methylase UbiE
MSLSRKIMRRERRSLEQLKEAYEIEKELSQQLRSVDKEERRKLYKTVYDEWNNRVLHNQYLSPQIDSNSSAKAVAIQKKLLTKFLNPHITFLEVGPGDCSLAMEIARVVKKVYAADVSSKAAEKTKLSENIEFVGSDGCSIPLPSESIHMAYSNQMMEHLHPEDAYEQLCNIYNVLTPDGRYLCVTPNRLCGPHDISQHFDDNATGFHLKEYTVTELEALFKRAGFSKIRLLLGALGVYVIVPALPVLWLESLLDKLPHALSRKISLLLPVKFLLGIKLLAFK